MSEHASTAIVCQECKALVKPASAYHPYLFCELVRLGHHDPAAYLRSYGFDRALANGRNEAPRD